MGFDAELTRALNSDDHAARERLLGLVHEDLRRIARAELARHRRGETLNTQALVNEAYLKLFGQSGGGDYASRKHFFATAARALGCPVSENGPMPGLPILPVARCR